MATRPAWTVDERNYVLRRDFEFKFNPGFAASQKKKNVEALHESIGKKALEISSKSEEELGRMLSAFNLKLHGIPFECVFQGSKKYNLGGPYTDLFHVSPKEAKRDERHHTSGNLIAFEYEGEEYPLKPLTFFYDYMYIQAVKESIPEEELLGILVYDFFTDIEFNPNKSINCQAKSVAILKAMLKRFGRIPDMNREDFLFFYQEIKA